MAPLLQALPDSLHGAMFLYTDWVDTPAVTFVRFIRINSVTGVETTVRVHTSTDTTGDYIELSGGVAVVYDTEAPLDTLVRYRVEGQGSALSDTTPDRVVASTGSLWLKDPVYLAHDVRVLLREHNGPQKCKPGEGVVFLSMDTETYAARSSLVDVDYAQFSLPVSKPRGAVSSTLTVATRTFPDRDAVLDVTAPGTVLLLQAPAQYGIPDRYLQIVSDVSVARVLPDHRFQWRTVTIPHSAVAVPASLSYGMAGMRWSDSCSHLSTFSSVTAAGVSWLDVMLGELGDNGTGPTYLWRTYQNVNDQFATYIIMSIVPNYTYLDLLEGR